MLTAKELELLVVCVAFILLFNPGVSALWHREVKGQKSGRQERKSGLSFLLTSSRPVLSLTGSHPEKAKDNPEQWLNLRLDGLHCFQNPFLQV